MFTKLNTFRRKKKIGKSKKGAYSEGWTERCPIFYKVNYWNLKRIYAFFAAPVTKTTEQLQERLVHSTTLTWITR